MLEQTKTKIARALGVRCAAVRPLLLAGSRIGRAEERKTGMEGAPAGVRNARIQISATCKQTIYKQTGWRGAPELSNGAGWRQRAQAMAAKQCRLLAAGGKILVTPAGCY